MENNIVLYIFGQNMVNKIAGGSNGIFLHFFQFIKVLFIYLNQGSSEEIFSESTSLFILNQKK